MARRRGKRHTRRNQFRIPLAIVAGLAPGVIRTVQGFQVGMEPGFRDAAIIWTGYDTRANTWNYRNLWYGTFPLLIGVIIHNVASRLGVNRAIARAGIPILRI